MAGVPNTQEDFLSSGSNITYQSSCLEAAELSHSLVPNSLNVLNMAESSSQMMNTTGHPQQMPVSNYRGNVMIKPIALKQLQTANSNYRPLLQQTPQLSSQSHLSPISSPILHHSSLSTSFPLAPPIPQLTPPIPPPIPIVPSHNSRINSSYNSALKSQSISQVHVRTNSCSSRGVSANKPRKPCNCKNSQCLKLYCDCFANGEFCRESCNCQNCKNSRHYEEDRTKAVKACLERNPNAFKPKVGHAQIGDSGRRHIKGCNCKKSGCLKNYCECYEAKIPCSYLCRCVGCQNLSDRPEGKGLMELANAADLRTQQQRAASNHFLEQMESPMYNQMTSDGHKLPYSYVNKDITKATALCLLEEASHVASSGQSSVEVERAVLIEFGRCLEQIINSSESANQSLRESVTGIV